MTSLFWDSFLCLLIWRHRFECFSSQTEVWESDSVCRASFNQSKYEQYCESEASPPSWTQKTVTWLITFLTFLTSVSWRGVSKRLICVLFIKTSSKQNALDTPESLCLSVCLHVRLSVQTLTAHERFLNDGCTAANGRVLTGGEGGWLAGLRHGGHARIAEPCGVFLCLETQGGDAARTLVPVVQVGGCARGRVRARRRGRTHVPVLNHRWRHLVTSGWGETRGLWRHDGWEVVHGVEFPGEALGGEGRGYLGGPVGVGGVALVEALIERLHQPRRTEPVLKRFEVPLPLPPLSAPVLKPNLETFKANNQYWMNSKLLKSADSVPMWIIPVVHP